MTHKKELITDDERQLFRDAMDNFSQTPEFSDRNDHLHDDTVTDTIFFSLGESQADVSGECIISYSKLGTQHKRFSQLKKGKTRSQATLDLHKLTREEAVLTIHQFLQRCQHQGICTVCIIHGKGHYSADNTPVLKNLLNHYLRQDPRVLAFHSAKNTQGGTGAVMVLLKSYRQ